MKLCFLFKAVIYVISIVIAAPQIGAANALAFIVGGQFAAAIIIDHYSFIGLPVVRISTYRIVGIVLLLAGVYMIQKR